VTGAPAAQADLLVTAKGGGAVFAGRLYAWGSRFVLAVLLARVLGATEYGLYTLALTVATVGSGFAILGLDAALVRFGAIYRSRGDDRSLRGALELGVAVPIAISLGMGAVFVIFSDWLASSVIGQPPVAPLLRMVGILIPALVANQQLAAILQGQRKIHLAVVAEQFTQQTIRGAILVVLAFVGLTAESALLASMLAAFSVTLLLVWLVMRSVRGIRAREARREVGAIARFSLPVYFSNLVNTLGGNLQTLLLGAMSSLSSVGVFSVAGHLQLVGSIFHSAVVSSSMPVFAALYDRGDRPALVRLYQTTSRWTLTLNMPFFLGALLFPEALLAIFGEEFRSGALALIILACGNVVNAATGSSGAVLDMSGHTMVKLVNATASVGLALVLNLLLIPPLGIVGAATAAAAAIAIVNVLRILEVRILVGVHPYNGEYAKPIVAGAVAAGFAFVLGRLAAGIGDLAAAGIGLLGLGIAYIAVIRLLGLTEDDRFVVARIRSRLLRRGRARPPSGSGGAAR
jgi:O-antigen/teichoic acid export membrane protein